MTAKIRGFLLIAVGAFVASAGPIFLLNATNVWSIPLSTWQTIISAGVAGVVLYVMAVVAPMAIKPSRALKLPEA
jgi:hypothetical protein